jgi:hypothetical protein
MFAINHAATGLVIKRAFPHVPLPWILLSVQGMELVWVALNYLGVEKTTTEDEVSYVGDIHLSRMPFSHSVATMLGVAFVAWLVLRLLGLPAIGWAVAIGVTSHLVLDLVTHDADITPAPFVGSPRLGLGLYARYPSAAFAVELVYGVLCWRTYRGSFLLLAVIVVFNLANLPMFSKRLGKVLQPLAGHPRLIVTVILIQIVVTLGLVWVLS